MDESGRFLIDGLDVYDTYGIVFREGTYNELFKLPTKKQDIIVDDWSDQNGKDRIFGTPFYDSMNYNLPIAHTGSSEADFFSKYESFKNYILNKQGYFNFDVSLTGKRYKLLYQDMPSMDKQTIIEDNAGNLLWYSVLSVINDHPVDVVTDGDVFFGASSEQPLTEGEITELVKEEETNTVTIDTGTTNRFFTIAIKHDINILSITDLDALMFNNVKSGYLFKGNVSIMGVNYKIYTLELAVPYSANHRHKVNLN